MVKSVAVSASGADVQVTPRSAQAGGATSGERNSAAPVASSAPALAAAAGSYVWPGVIANSVYVWNYWNTSTTVTTSTVVPSGARFTYVGWTASATTYTTQYPGSLQLEFCSTAPIVRCYNVTSVPDATTSYFNDLDPARAKFVLKYRWYNSTKTDGSALVGAGVRPFVNGSIDVGWN